jgi:hypothetical protein
MHGHRNLKHATRKFQINMDGLKLKGMHQLLVYADDVNIVGGNVHTVKKYTEALVVTGKKKWSRGKYLANQVCGHVSRSACRTES